MSNSKASIYRYATMYKKALTTVRALRCAVLEDVAVGGLADRADVDHQRLSA